MLINNKKYPLIMEKYFKISRQEDGRLRAYPHPDGGRQWYGIAKDDPHIHRVKEGCLVFGSLRTISPKGKSSFQVLDIMQIYTPQYKFVGVELDSEKVPCLVYDHTDFDESITYGGGRRNCYVESYVFNGMKTVRVYAPLCKGQSQGGTLNVLDTIEKKYQDAELYSSILAQSPTAMVDAHKAVAAYHKSLEGFKSIGIKSFSMSWREENITMKCIFLLTPQNIHLKPTELTVNVLNEDIPQYLFLAIKNNTLSYQINWDMLLTLPEIGGYDLTTTVKPTGYHEVVIAQLNNHKNTGHFITDLTKYGQVFGYDVFVSYPTGTVTLNETIKIDGTTLSYNDVPSIIRVTLIPNNTSSILAEEVFVDITNIDEMRGYTPFNFNMLDVKAYENMPKSAPVITGNVEGIIESLLNKMYI